LAHDKDGNSLKKPI